MNKQEQIGIRQDVYDRIAAPEIKQVNNRYLDDFQKIQELMSKTMVTYCTEFLEKKGIESPLSEENKKHVLEQLKGCSSDRQYIEIVNNYLQSFHQGHLFLKENDDDESKSQDDKQVFPLIVRYANGKYIGVSNDANIDGQAISEINGIPITQYVQTHIFDQGHRTFAFDKEGKLYNPEFQINDDTCTITLENGISHTLEPINKNDAEELKKQKIAKEQAKLGIKDKEGNIISLSSNVVCGYKDGIPYIQIKQFDRNKLEQAKEQLIPFAKEIAGQTDLIIDIRGNGGGTDEYFEYLGLFADKKYQRKEQFKSLVGLNNQEANEVFGHPQDIDIALERIDANPNSKVESCTFSIPNGSSASIPNGQSTIKNRVLLVDGKVFSSADKFTKLAKDSGFATIVGSQPTAGDGDGFTTYSVDTPLLREQGLSITMPSSMGIDFDDFQTTPDIMVSEHEINVNLGQIMEQAKDTIINHVEAPQFESTLGIKQTIGQPVGGPNNSAPTMSSGGRAR